MLEGETSDRLCVSENRLSKTRSRKGMKKGMEESERGKNNDSKLNESELMALTCSLLKDSSRAYTLPYFMLITRT